MKNLLAILAVLALSALSVTPAKAQSTNSGVVVTPSAPSTVYTPITITANPANAASLSSTYLAPFLVATGATLPSGTVPKVTIIYNYANGSQRCVIMPCLPGQLPPAPLH